jgi:hypothetical protein
MFPSTLPSMLSRTLPIALDGTLPACLTVRSQVSSQDALKHTPEHALKYTPNCTRWHTPSLLDYTLPSKLSRRSQAHYRARSQGRSQLHSMALPACVTVRSQVSSQGALKHTPRRLASGINPPRYKSWYHTLSPESRTVFPMASRSIPILSMRPILSSWPEGSKPHCCTYSHYRKLILYMLSGAQFLLRVSSGDFSGCVTGFGNREWGMFH